MKHLFSFMDHMKMFVFPVCFAVMDEEKAVLDKAQAEAAVPGAEDGL